MTTEILTSPDVDQHIITTTVEDIDDDAKVPNLRHIVRPFDNGNPLFYSVTKHPTAQDIVDIARIRGLEVTALCGKVWIPTSEGKGLDTCDPCIAMAGMIKGGS